MIYTELQEMRSRLAYAAGLLEQFECALPHMAAVALKETMEDIPALLTQLTAMTTRATTSEALAEAAIADINAILRNGTDECRHHYCKRGNEVDGCDSDNCEDAEWRGRKEQPHA